MPPFSPSELVKQEGGEGRLTYEERGREEAKFSVAHGIKKLVVSQTTAD